MPNRNSRRILGEFAHKLFESSSFDQAFSAYQEHVFQLNFEGVLYTYIPRPLVESNFHQKPVYIVSNSYSPEYLTHYAEARFEKYDPLIKAVNSNVSEVVDWHGDICEHFQGDDPKSKEVIETSRLYGITNGLTIPTMNDRRALSGASFISSESHHYQTLLRENSGLLASITKIFHALVASDAIFHSKTFIKPLFSSLSEKELRLLKYLAEGKAPCQIEGELGCSAKYIEQLMLSLRRKVSGFTSEPQKTINRNQLLYYAGLLNFMDT